MNSEVEIVHLRRISNRGQHSVAKKLSAACRKTHRDIFATDKLRCCLVLLVLQVTVSQLYSCYGYCFALFFDSESPHSRLQVTNCAIICELHSNLIDAANIPAVVIRTCLFSPDPSSMRACSGMVWGDAKCQHVGPVGVEVDRINR